MKDPAGGSSMLYSKLVSGINVHKGCTILVSVVTPGVY